MIAARWTQHGFGCGASDAAVGALLSRAAERAELGKQVGAAEEAEGEIQLLRTRALLVLGKRKDAEQAAAAAVSADPKLKDKAAALLDPTAAASPAPAAQRAAPPAAHRNQSRGVEPVPGCVV